MATGNIPDIDDDVKAAINQLGQDATPQQIADIVAAHARDGVPNGSPELRQLAAEQALAAYQDQGMAPGKAATLGAVKAYEEGQKSKPSLQEQAQNFLGNGTEVPTADAVRELPGVSMGDHDEALDEATDRMGAADIPPGLAAQAQLAIANAASGGTMVASGLEIHGKLKVTVHDYVSLDYQDSQIKTTVGPVQYNHHGNVTIRANAAYLTADSIDIQAHESETNIVRGEKISNVNSFSLGWGPWYQSNFGSTTSKFAFSVTAAGVNMHVAPVKAGVAVRMVTRYAGRTGIKGISFDDTEDHVSKANLALMGVSVLMMFI